MVFISYKRENRKQALLVRERLDEAGFPTWMDVDIKAGEEWKPAIDNAIRRNDTMVVIVTPLSMQSPYVTYEWSTAKAIKKLVVPLVFEYPDPKNAVGLPKEIHPKLRDIQELDFTKANKRPWNSLIDVLSDFGIEEDVPPELSNANARIYDALPEIRKAGFYVLQTHPSRIATRFLSNAVNSQYRDISAEAGLCLSHRKDADIATLILGLSNALRTTNMKQEALNTLASINNLDAVTCVEEYFDEIVNNPSLDANVSKVIQAAINITHPGVFPLLLKMLQQPKGRPVALVPAIGRFRNPDALPYLASHVQELQRNWSGLQSVVKAMAEIGDPAALPLIESILKSLSGRRTSGEYELFQSIMEALIAIGGAYAYTIIVNTGENRNFAELYQEIQKAVFSFRQKYPNVT